MWAPAPAQANWLGTNGSGTGRSAAAITRSRAGLTYRIKAIFNIVKRAPDGGDSWDIHGRAGIRENRRRIARRRFGEVRKTSNVAFCREDGFRALTRLVGFPILQRSIN